MENFPYYFYALLPSKPDLNCVGSREKGSQNDSICLGRLFMKRIQHFLFLLASTVFFLFFIFVVEIVLLLQRAESDTTIPILRQRGYKLIRYTGTMTRHFLLVCIVYFCWKMGLLISGILLDLLIIRRDVMAICNNVKGRRDQRFYYYLSVAVTSQIIIRS